MVSATSVSRSVAAVAPGAAATVHATHAGHAGRGGDVFRPGVGLLLRLNVYAPRGLTPYGWRKQQARRRMVPGAGGQFSPWLTFDLLIGAFTWLLLLVVDTARRGGW